MPLPAQPPLSGVGLPTAQTAPLAGPPAVSVDPTLANAVPVDGYPQPPLQPTPHAGDAYSMGGVVEAAYQTVGRITVESLLHGTRDQWRHLDDRVKQTREWVQERLANEGVSDRIAAARLGDPQARHEVYVHVDRLLFQYLSSASVVRGGDKQILAGLVINEILGLGPVEPLWADPSITEVMINDPDHVYVEKDGKNIPVPGCRFRDDEHVLEVANAIFNPINRRLDPANPKEDGRLPDGSRVNGTHRVISPAGSTLTIRRFREQIWTLPDFVDSGQMPEQMARFLATLVDSRCSTLLAGGTGSGKTTMLNALSCCVPRNERIVTVEDSMELQFHPEAHVVGLEARPASASGKGEITIRALVKNSLRMRPDRIVVGEVRDATAFDMLQAMNTGHEGSMSTLHANRAQAILPRLKSMVSAGGDIPANEVLFLIAEAIDIVVYVRRYGDGSRRVDSVYEVPTMEALPAASSGDMSLPLRELWKWVITGVDDDGRMHGEYEQINDISDELKEAKGWNRRELMGMDEVRRVSALPVKRSGS